MDTGLRGKTALITGGASGIGFGISMALAQEGVNLAVASRKPDPAALDELRALGVKVVAISTDVSQEDQVNEMVRTAISSLGHLDMYINNAAWSWHEPITKLTTESWMKTINTNLSACVWACREVSRHMIERRQGSILIIGSTAMLNPLYQETSYRVSKTGLKVFAEVLAIELAPYGIRVNTLIPGYFPTRLVAGMTDQVRETLISQIPLRRPGRIEDVGAQAVVLLSDKLSGYTTGAHIVIDGGLHLRPLPFYTDQELLALNAFGQ
ncbi:MAG: SDR family oxidoreductase [Firmicutes bacterium]|nr:SDR family oxidoreductase [Bacillota bacterium]